MRLFPEKADELAPNLRWAVELRLQIIEELVCGSQTSEAGVPGREESWERAWRAMERRDRKAEDEALVDRTRAEMWEWWREFPEHRLLTDLYEQAARRAAKTGSRYSRRHPSFPEGFRAARAMLADLPDPGPLDPEWEYTALFRTLAYQLLHPTGVPSRPRVAILH